MTALLPDNLLRLFYPRPPLRFLPPTDHDPAKRHTVPITGLASVLAQAKEVDAKYKNRETAPVESEIEKRARIKAENRAKAEYMRTDGLKEYKPNEDPKINGDPYCTLIVARLDYKLTEDDIKQAFAKWGGLQASVRIVMNSKAKPTDPIKRRHKGYAFIMFKRHEQAKAAYKEANGMKLGDRYILVDVERGRTVDGWHPRRMGGGLGGRGYTKAQKFKGFGAPNGPGAFPGRGFRGGFRGGHGGGYSGDRRYDSRGGMGNQNGLSGPPDGAPSGPRGPRQSSGPGGYRGGRDERHGGRYEDRPRNGPSGSNREPVGPRGGGGGYRDRDRDGGYDDRDRDRDRDRESRKRGYDGDGYDDPRSKRRY